MQRSFIEDLMTDLTTHIKLIDGQAEVKSATHRYRVARRDLPDSPFSCPVELVVGALGS
jgi:hypothetical protein